MLFGTFDIVHAGHIHMFRQAREYGDYLVVSVARDINAEKVKGEAPLHNEQERLEFLKHIDLIDEVVLGAIEDPYHHISIVRPHVIALGYDQKTYVDNLANALTQYGIEAEIVRLRPYEEQRFKSSKLKKYMERIV